MLLFTCMMTCSMDENLLAGYPKDKDFVYESTNCQNVPIEFSPAKPTLLHTCDTEAGMSGALLKGYGG